jgi:hypothetical protein
MKMNKSKLRNFILEVASEPSRKRRSAAKKNKSIGTKAFRESTKKAMALISEATDTEPKGTKFTKKSNFVDFDDATIDELFAQIKTKDLEQPIFQAQKFKDDEGETQNPDPAATASWLESTGEDVVRERIKAVAAKIPSTGIPKSEMPFLPGPSDAAGSVEDVIDALTPGGKLNVGFGESKKPTDTLIMERWSRLAGMNEVAPPAANALAPGSDAAEEYLASGHPDNDGKPPGNDDASPKKGVSIPAADAIPTQSNILIPKALGMAVNGVSGGDLGAYFSANNEILDGHHRWAATMLNDPTANIGGFASIDLEAMGGTKTALKHLTALGNALGNETKTS